MTELHGWEKPISYMFENYGDVMVAGIEYMFILVLLFWFIGFPVIVWKSLCASSVYRENPVHTLRYKELDKLAHENNARMQRTAESDRRYNDWRRKEALERFIKDNEEFHKNLKGE